MELLDQWKHLLGEGPTRVIGLTVWLFLIMLLLVPLERVWPLKRQKVFRKDFNDDLFYYFLGGVLPAFFVAAVSYVAILGQRLLPDTFYDGVAALPFWLRLGATVVLGEIAYYWAHRGSHEIPCLWRFHSIHHSPTEMDWLVNTRAHPVDLAIARSLSAGFLLLLGLGHGAGNNLLELVALIVIFNTTWGFFIHSNLRIRLGYLEYLITTPAFHHWHHANHGSAVRNKNYSALLPWVDKLFGTYYLPQRQFPNCYGIVNSIPSDLIGQILMPFRRSGNRSSGDINSD